jgi:hypothetical protein
MAPTYIIENVAAIDSIFGDDTISKPVALRDTSIGEITE